MFACSPVETKNIFYNPKSSFNNKTKREPTTSNNMTRSSSSPCNNFFYNALISENDQQKKRFQQFHEASQRRNQLKQEIQRRHQLCADNERQCRARAEKQTALKKVEECNALRRFYEIKSAQLKNNCSTTRNNCLKPASFSSPNSSSCSFLSTREFPSKSKSSSIKKFQAAYKIHSFIKHYIEKRNTQKIISCLIKLRSIQNRLAVLKSINLKVRTLTFDSTNQVLPISVNNKAFLLYRESILKVLKNLDEDFTDELYLVRERKQLMINVANNILKELDNEQNYQYNKYIKNLKKNNEVEDFVIL